MVVKFVQCYVEVGPWITLSVQSESIHSLSGDSLQGFTSINYLSEAIQDTNDTNPLTFLFLYGVPKSKPYSPHLCI